MSDAATRQDIDEVVGILKDFMTHVDDRMTAAEQRQANFEQRIERRLDGLDDKFNRLMTTIDGFISRSDKYETELTARDSQFEKLLAWARKVSEKTGIPLENL